jgi:ABC-2 type transport system permease protein
MSAAVSGSRWGELAARFPAYAKVTTLTTQRIFAYRLNIAFELVGLLLQIFLLKVVWTAIYADRGSVDGVDLGTLLTYLTIAQLQIWVVWPETTWFLQNKIREGKIALDLARPIGLIPQLIGHQVGSTLVFLPIAILVLPVAFFVGVLGPPASIQAGILYVVSVILAYGVVTWMGLLMGMIAFWLLEIGGIEAIYRFSNMFFAGALVPLWLFPEPLRTVAGLLPFQTQANIPVSIYIGRLTGADALHGLAIQAAWFVILGLLVRFIWSRAMRKVVVQGG